MSTHYSTPHTGEGPVESDRYMLKAHIQLVDLEQKLTGRLMLLILGRITMKDFTETIGRYFSVRT